MINHVLRAAHGLLIFFGLNVAGGVGALAAANSATTMEVSLHVTASCVVSAEPLSFGSLDESNASGAGAASSIEVACTGSAPFTVMLDDGLNAGTGARRALDPASGKYVSYDIYTNAQHTKRWGGLGSEVFGQGDPNGATRLLAYGAIKSTQVTAGDYRDRVTVTVAY